MDGIMAVGDLYFKQEDIRNTKDVTKGNASSSHYIDICLNKSFCIHFISITNLITQTFDPIFDNFRDLRLNPIFRRMNPITKKGYESENLMSKFTNWLVCMNNITCSTLSNSERWREALWNQASHIANQIVYEG